MPFTTLLSHLGLRLHDHNPPEKRPWWKLKREPSFLEGLVIAAQAQGLLLSVDGDIDLRRMEEGGVEEMKEEMKEEKKVEVKREEKKKRKCRKEYEWMERTLERSAKQGEEEGERAEIEVSWLPLMLARFIYDHTIAKAKKTPDMEDSITDLSRKFKKLTHIFLEHKDSFTVHLTPREITSWTNLTHLYTTYLLTLTSHIRYHTSRTLCAQHLAQTIAHLRSHLQAMVRHVEFGCYGEAVSEGRRMAVVAVLEDAEKEWGVIEKWVGRGLRLD